MLFDYTSVTAESVKSVVEDAIARAEDTIASIVEGDPTWDQTVGAIDGIEADLAETYGQGPFMARVHSDEEIRTAAVEAEERLNLWVADLPFRRDLYEAIERYATTEEAASLEGERRRLLDWVRRDFRRSGQELSEEERAELQKLNSRLTKLGVDFSRNLDEHRDWIDLDTESLVGLSDAYVSRLQEVDGGRKRVSLDYPEYYPFMDQSPRRDLREALQFKMFNKAVDSNEAILEEAVTIRRRIAEIFGQPSWAHHAMEVKMAKDPKRVEAFYADLVPALNAKADDELEALEELLDDSERPVSSWDFRHLHTKMKRAMGVDPEEVAAYFPLEQVLDGMFEITAEVFALSYERVDAPVWHPDVTAYEIRDSRTGETLAHFYADLFPREGKFGHAAAFPLVPGHRLDDGSYQTPVTAIVANFTKPTASSPSLLQHNEVTTLFHEFGHILHNSLGHTELVRFSGFATEWDFVEAPSQIMEHWCWTSEVLRRFARHHETGEPIPEELVDRLVEARDLNIALFTLRQCQFGMLDLAFHGPGSDKALREIDAEAAAVSRFPHHEGTFFPAGFGHLFGYDAGYYGYLWSKVYGDDMFSRFAEEGVTNPDVGMAYREKVLGPGGSRDADELLVDFLGREPNNKAFLANLGIEA